MSLDSYDLGTSQAPRRALSPRRPSTLINRNITVAGHRTSVRLEPAMWDALHHVCDCEQKSLNDVVTAIAQGQVESSLTAAIRVFLMSYFRAAAMQVAHPRLAASG
jgi:predicted DNA-binding ribbon-helix-helix protein